MQSNIRNALFAASLLATIAIAQQVSQSLQLTVNGKVLSEKALIVGGKTYYPESALPPLGVTVKRTGNAIALTSKGATGGANQTAALEGCVGETLFNGALRAILHSLEPFEQAGKAVGWTADLEFRNGTQQVSNLSGFGTGGGTSWYIAYNDNTTYPFYITDSNGLNTGQDLPAGSSYRVKINFWPDTSNNRDLPFDPTRKPTKLLLGFTKTSASSDVQKLLLTNPGFRIRLNCKK